MKETSLDIIDYKKSMYSNYAKYISTFIPIYLSNLKTEFEAVSEQFPNINFGTIARIKNPNSYFEKVNSKPKDYTFSDIYANKYVINSINGLKDEKTLIRACYELFDFLVFYNQKSNNLLLDSTDYIKSPKDSNYRSLHLKFQSNSNIDLRFETQIKTGKMRWNEKFGEASHAKAYKKRKHVKLENIPIYIGPVFDEHGDIEFRLQSKEQSFCEYYGFTYEEYLKRQESR